MATVDDDASEPVGDDAQVEAAPPAVRDTRTRQQKRAQTQREGEDVYAYIARTIRTSRPKDLLRLYMMRERDTNQLEAMRLWVDMRMVRWTRALAIGTVVLGACTIVAAFIVRS